MKDIFLKLMFNMFKNWMEYNNDLHFYLKEWKLKKSKSLPKRNLKQTLNHRLVLKTVRTVIKFNQNDCLKPYLDMNSDLRKKQKILFLSWWIMQLLEKPWKIWENVGILNFIQQKEEETIWFQNQIVIVPSFSQKIY